MYNCRYGGKIQIRSALINNDDNDDDTKNTITIAPQWCCAIKKMQKLL